MRTDAELMASYYPLWSMRELLHQIAKHEQVDLLSWAVLVGELRDRVFAYLPTWSRSRGARR